MAYMEIVERLMATDGASELPDDPRADLVEDSHLWRVVLQVAKNLDPFKKTKTSIFGTLHAIRCMGAQLILRNGNLQLKPRLGDEKVTDFQDLQDWEMIREKWLLPHEQILRNRI